MWRPEEEIRADLQSGSAERVANGLRDLVDAMEGFDEFPIAPPGVEILEPLGFEPPREVLDWFVALMDQYEEFEPDLEEGERFRRMVEVALRYGKSRVATHVTDLVKIRANKLKLIADLLSYVDRRGVGNNDELYGIRVFVEELLDGVDEVRSATLRALSVWREPLRRRVVDWIWPKLTETEKQELGEALGEGAPPKPEADAAVSGALPWKVIAVEIGSEWRRIRRGGSIHSGRSDTARFGR